MLEVDVEVNIVRAMIGLLLCHIKARRKYRLVQSTPQARKSRHLSYKLELEDTACPKKWVIGWVSLEMVLKLIGLVLHPKRNQSSSLTVSCNFVYRLFFFLDPPSLPLFLPSFLPSFLPPHVVDMLVCTPLFHPFFSMPPHFSLPAPSSM